MCRWVYKPSVIEFALPLVLLITIAIVHVLL